MDSSRLGDKETGRASSTLNLFEGSGALTVTVMSDTVHFLESWHNRTAVAIKF